MGQCFDPSMASLGLLLVLVLAAAVPTGGLNPRKLDDASAPGSEKCSTCTPLPPPPATPPPPSPCPPPPALPPPPPPQLPHPPPKKPPSPYCPPPPPSPSSYIYITGPPGSLYPIDQEYNGAPAGRAPLLVGLGLLGLLALW